MFTLKLEEINFENINTFYEEQIPEGETLEYKGDLPKDLEKSISAMANTYGGIILIGVKADQIKNLPILPIEGIALIKGLEERVTSICLRSIVHPYFPQVKVCEFKNDKEEDRAVVFIRVHESDQTPHAINNNTDVYLRIRSQNEPLKKGALRKATLEEIDWLKNRRQKAIENREVLIEQADQRFNSIPYDLVDQKKIEMAHQNLHSSYREVSIIPLFPSKPLFEYSELLRLKDCFDNPKDQIFYLAEPVSSSNSLSFPEVRRTAANHPYAINYTEFNIFGLVYNKHSLWENSDPKTKDLFDVSYFLKQIFRVVTVGMAIYEKVGYLGSVLIEVKVEGILGKQIGTIDIRRAKNGWFTNIIEPHIHIIRTDTFSGLNENLENIIIDICKEFLWCCGAGERIQEDSPTMIDLKNLYKTAKDSF
jgi:hypothetical protein